MNSLNILSGRVSPVQTPSPSRSNSFGNILSSAARNDADHDTQEHASSEKRDGQYDGDASTYKHEEDEADEKQFLLEDEKLPAPEKEATGWLALPKRIASTFIDTLRWLLTTVASPGLYLVSLLYNEDGMFMPFSVFHRHPVTPATSNLARKTSKRTEIGSVKVSRKDSTGRRLSTRESRILSSNSSSSGMSSESEQERDGVLRSKSGKLPRMKPSHLSDEISPARRSIRIKLHNEDSLRQRNRRKSQSVESNGADSVTGGEITPANLKSPTSPPSSLSMTKYPRAPAPPRPIVPRRQPSFTLHEGPGIRGGQKTLVLDLDETLIHSMAKGGRMGTGHMVEVKLNTVVGSGSNATPGPQHPILYYVHKRPHCDEFLRKICKWYNLVIFTASVQEYADPVIDWLEQERKFFSGRFYRQHCTYRHNAFIKDLSSVEPDLSKVMILDNSPLSYMFHQDNAIPIEGWINDPSDNDLLHLVPLLEGLQHVTDVRAFLALRGGEDGKHV